jgi:hypothetical protein
MVFSKLLEHQQRLEKALQSRAFLSPESSTSQWQVQNYQSCFVRRANLDIIDARESKKLYMLHLCVFPKVFDGAPIFGFDIIAGPNKVTGAFLDFSPVVKDHPMMDWFHNRVKELEWSKPRELPEWAQSIFSGSMVAAGNIGTGIELDTVLDLSLECLTYHLDNMKKFRPRLTYEQLAAQYDYTQQQNFYCQQQKQNPHTPRVLKSLGFDEQEVNDYIHHELFPELV